MTIDERLDRLTARHEVLTQSVELLKLTVDGLQKTSEEHLRALQQDGENIQALARIAEIHERRLSDLEGQP
jgi:archaellum component FlaC